MRAHVRYLRIVLRHKWFVLVAGLRVGGIPTWRLVVHDWSKFTRAEWSPYVRRFASGRAGQLDHAADPAEWNAAFAHHVRHNPHHWEYWLTSGHVLQDVPTEMPEPYAREMVADWMGAGRGYTGRWDVEDWYEANRDLMKLHPQTRALVERLIYPGRTAP